MPHQDFDVLNVAGLQQEEEVTFGLAGKTFRVLPQIPAGASASLGSFTWTSTAMVAFLRGCLVADDEDAFDEVISAKDIIVTTKTLADIANFVMGSKAGRPLATSSGSSNGHPTTETASTET